MNKYSSARSISDQKKILLIQKAVQGVPVSRICKEENISRTIFYRWVKQSQAQDLLVGAVFKRDRKKHYRRTIGVRIERKVINYARMKPAYTIRQYPAHAGISTRAVWLILKERQLSSRVEREAYFQTHGNRIYTPTSHQAKIELLKRSLEGEQISTLCSKHGISRTTFYKWLSLYKAAGNRYEALQSNRPTGAGHYRHIKGLEEAILTVIQLHPDYSLSQILSSITAADAMPVSRSGVYKVLQRFGLTTLEDRIAYAKRYVLTNTLPNAPSNSILPAVPRYSYISFLSPPTRELVTLLHILYFDDLHQELSGDNPCAICTTKLIPETVREFIEEQFQEVDDE